MGWKSWGTSAWLVGLCALAGAHTAQAQAWPSYMGGGRLTKQDIQIMDQATADLHRSPATQIGDTAHWTNPASGNAGTATLVDSMELRGMNCWKVRYDFTFAKGSGPRTYSINWCHTPQDTWRIVD
jgi:hypothetical protein